MDTDGFEFYPAGEDVLLILTGVGGNAAGYENKYVKIAENAVKKHGFSVCVAPTPTGIWERPKEHFESVLHFLSGKTGGSGKIYAMGNSAGATLLIWYSCLFPQIQRVLAVNPVLNINLDRANGGVKNFNGEKIEIAAGERDASHTFSQCLRKSDKVTVTVFAGADHNFTGKTDLFISLPEKFLF